MLIVPSQFESVSPYPEIVYVGLHPIQSPLENRNDNSTSFTLSKNVTIIVTFAPTFTSSYGSVVQWGVVLGLLTLSSVVAICILTLMCRMGVKKLRGTPISGGGGSSTNRYGELPSEEFGPESPPISGSDFVDEPELRTKGRAKAYLWMITLAGLFYLLPALQTANSEASSMLITGNRDTCFYNEECMFPLQTFGPYGLTWWAANNVISNAGYVMGGLALFSWTMWCKRHWKKKEVVLRVLALPTEYTLFYCLAIALLYEGFMVS